MKADIKQKWVDALRSGEYKQGTGQLKCEGTNTFCCLGVLTDVYAKEFDIDFADAATEFLGKKPNAEYPTNVVAQWAGLHGNNPHIEIECYNDESEEKCLETHPIATLNDDFEYSFLKLANLIESQL